MNAANLIVLAILLSFAGIAVQRTERKRRWLVALLLLLPSGFLIYRWAIYRGQILETLLAAGIALALNALFWLVYGRRNPPASSDDIQVIGMDD